MKPEGMHSLENLETTESASQLKAPSRWLRIEIKTPQ